MLLECQSYVISFVCHSHVICVRSYFIYMYSYVILRSLVCTRMSSVCHSYVPVSYSYVLVSHSYVSRMYSYVIRMSLVCGFTMNPRHENKYYNLKCLILFNHNMPSIIITIFQTESFHLL